jgi:hypothetical protein
LEVHTVLDGCGKSVLVGCGSEFRSLRCRLGGKVGGGDDWMCCESVPTKRSLREGAGVTAAQNATPRRMQSIAGARKQVGTHNCIDVGCWMLDGLPGKACHHSFLHSNFHSRNNRAKGEPDSCKTSRMTNTGRWDRGHGRGQWATNRQG